MPQSDRSTRSRFSQLVWLMLATFLFGAPRATAQEILRSSQPWRTLETQWFTVHYPLDTEPWALDLAPRLDAIRTEVAALVGYAPPGRTTIVIDDPYNVPNGSAIPLLGAPTIHLWVTPPGPTDQIANHRGWGIKLAAHEFGHIAHLSRPARRSQWFWHLLPAQVSPLSISTPRWAIEGYATWIEGRITGSGRPHGAWRPALLRELAIGGRLPSYGAMSGVGGFKGGSMAYLAGSAFWEWLSVQRGDTAMPLVFRRQTARTGRSFDAAFRGVYGDSPAMLYGRFSAELTAKAMTVDSALRIAGVVSGTRLTRFASVVGSPAVSRDGKRMAIVIPGLNGAKPRLVISAPDTLMTSDVERRALVRSMERDAEDVPAIRLYPRLAKPIVTLLPRRGKFFKNPRFITSDGTQVLLESWSVRADGSQRPDLVTWNTATGAITPLTRNAAVQDADPSPDGSRAAAVRCVGGSCDLVFVSLASGAVTTLVAGSPTRVFNHPRFSPNGTMLSAGVQDRDGIWRLVLVDAQTGITRIVSPNDSINRHSASFDARGEQLVYVSESGGIPNVESMQLSDSHITQRTRVVGSVYHPTPMPNGSVLFLSEYAGGMDLQRVDSTHVVSNVPIGIDLASLAPAMPRAREPETVLAVAPVAAPRAYGAGPRRYRLLGHTAMARDGIMHGGALTSADPANKFTWMLSGVVGTAAAWRGGVASAAWYGSRPNLRAEFFWLEQRASRQKAAQTLGVADLRLAGGALQAELPILGSTSSQRLLASVFAGRAQQDTLADVNRMLLSVHYNASTSVGWRKSAGVFVRTAAGSTDDTSFVRASFGVSMSAFSTQVDARMHRASDNTPLIEQFSAGGFAPPVNDDATLAQRLAIPALPVGIARGRELYEYRISHPMLFLPGTLYAHSVGAQWSPDKHSAVIGLEQGFAFDHLGIVGMPRIRVLGGVAYIVRGPLRDKSSAYLMFRWRP